MTHCKIHNPAELERVVGELFSAEFRQLDILLGATLDTVDLLWIDAGQLREGLSDDELEAIEAFVGRGGSLSLSAFLGWHSKGSNAEIHRRFGIDGGHSRFSAAEATSVGLHDHVVAPELRPLLAGPFGRVVHITNRGQMWYRCIPWDRGPMSHMATLTPVWQRRPRGRGGSEGTGELSRDPLTALAYSCADRHRGQVLVPSNLHLFGNPGLWGGGQALHDADNARLLCNFVHGAAMARRLRAHHAAHPTTAPRTVALPVWWSHHIHAAVGSSPSTIEVMTILLGLPARWAQKARSAPPVEVWLLIMSFVTRWELGGTNELQGPSREQDLVNALAGQGVHLSEPGWLVT